MDPTSLSKQLEITDEQIIGKANEYMRLMQIRSPMGIGPNELCKGAACLILSFKQFAYSTPTTATTTTTTTIDKKKVCQICCVTLQQLQSAILLVSRILGISETVLSTREVCRRVGQMSLLTQVESTLSLFKEKFLEKLPLRQRQYVDFSGIVYIGAALYVVGFKKKVKNLTKNQLASKLDIPVNELQRVINVFQTTLPDLASMKSPTEMKRKKEDEEGEGEEIEPEKKKQQTEAETTVNNEPIPMETTTATATNKEIGDKFEEIRASIIGNDEKILQEQPAKRKLKQTTLKF